MKVKKYKKSKVISSFIIGILLMFSIVLSAISLFTKFVVLDSEKYINILEKKEIHKQIYDFLDGNLGYVLVINSIDSHIKDGVISEEELRIEVNSFIRSVVNFFLTGINDIKEVDIDKYSSRFDENLKNYLRENSIFINDNLQNEINTLKNEVNQIIKNELEIVNADIIVNSKSGIILARIIKIFVNGFYLIPIIIVGILIVILNFIWRGDTTRFFQWLGNGIMSAGLFIFLLFFSGYISGFYNNVNINIVYLKEFISSLIKNWLFILWLNGVLLTIVGSLMLLPLIKNYIKRSKMIKKH